MTSLFSISHNCSKWKIRNKRECRFSIEGGAIDSYLLINTYINWTLWKLVEPYKSSPTTIITPNHTKINPPQQTLSWCRSTKFSIWRVLLHTCEPHERIASRIRGVTSHHSVSTFQTIIWQPFDEEFTVSYPNFLDCRTSLISVQLWELSGFEES
jgi:hypothetical protein